jgi:catechol 2,3-dioxygenase-like lactoylglutathione lyase family enzyme
VNDVYRISAVTLIIKNMKRSCNFYSQIPGFKLVYGGSSTDTFTTYLIGYDYPSIYLNLELHTDTHIGDFNSDFNKRHFGRIIFHTEDVDKLYSYFKNSKEISDTVVFENESKDAPWGERYFHLREPDGYQLSLQSL